MYNTSQVDGPYYTNFGWWSFSFCFSLSLLNSFFVSCSLSFNMLNNIFMIDYLICHTFIFEANNLISKLIKKHNRMHVIFNNIPTGWLVIYRECSHLSDKNLMFVMCSGVARRVTWEATPCHIKYNRSACVAAGCHHDVRLVGRSADSRIHGFQRIERISQPFPARIQNCQISD